MLIVYGVWHAAPFAFVVFYAGLQTLPKDQFETAHDRWRHPGPASALCGDPAPDAAW